MGKNPFILNKLEMKGLGAAPAVLKNSFRYTCNIYIYIYVYKHKNIHPIHDTSCAHGKVTMMRRSQHGQEPGIALITWRTNASAGL